MIWIIGWNFFLFNGCRIDWMIDWLIDWLIREVYPDGESTSPYVFICKNPQVNYLTVIEIQISWSLFFVSTWQLAVRYWFGLKVIFKSFPRINFKRKYCFGYLNVFFLLQSSVDINLPWVRQVLWCEPKNRRDLCIDSL